MRRVAEVALVFGLQTETKQTCVRLINLVLDTKNKLNLSLQTPSAAEVWYPQRSKGQKFNFKLVTLFLSVSAHEALDSSTPSFISFPTSEQLILNKWDVATNSQTSLCRGSRTVWPIQSRRRWRCSGRRETHTRSSRQLCRRFEAKSPKLRLPGCWRRDDRKGESAPRLVVGLARGSSGRPWAVFVRYLVHVAQVILSMAIGSLTSFPEGTSNTCRL